MVVLPDEVLQNCAPLLGAFDVTCSFAREHQRATDVSKCLQGCRLTAGGRGHRLVELCQAVIDVSPRYPRESQLCERAKLQIGVSRP